MIAAAVSASRTGQAPTGRNPKPGQSGKDLREATSTRPQASGSRDPYPGRPAPVKPLDELIIRLPKASKCQYSQETMAALEPLPWAPKQLPPPASQDKALCSNPRPAGKEPRPLLHLPTIDPPPSCRQRRDEQASHVDGSPCSPGGAHASWQRKMNKWKR